MDFSLVSVTFCFSFLFTSFFFLLLYMNGGFFWFCDVYGEVMGVFILAGWQAYGGGLIDG